MGNRKSHIRYLYRVGTSKKRETHTVALVIPPDVLSEAALHAGDPVQVEILTGKKGKYIILIPVPNVSIPKVQSQ